ncbi:MAG: 5-formyltetrahydrofolate cyclo-ligase [Rhodospirillales bacterium]|nr:5-formyltetrahydrofolate cyclo-ligase [Rhodospirillales bacterium]
MADEVASDYFDPLGVDPEQARDVARWRRAERVRLRAERQAISVEARRAAGAALADHLRDHLAARFGSLRGRVFSAYWPIKGEPDLRPLMAEMDVAGVRVALPVVEVRHAPLSFRRWTPKTRPVRGDWDIPVPPPEAEFMIPDVALAPLVGWDRRGYRLGYGGGYFDRTLAGLSTRPYVIGVGLQATEVATIYPQWHDVRLDAIVTRKVSGHEPARARRRDAPEAGSALIRAAAGAVVALRPATCLPASPGPGTNFGTPRRPLPRDRRSDGERPVSLVPLSTGIEPPQRSGLQFVGDLLIGISNTD